MLPDLRHELILDEQTQLERRISKCPEIEVKCNGDVTVLALLDTGSAINGISEEWFNRNKQRLRPYEELRMNNTLIVSAVGGKSKLIRKQIMCEIFIDDVRLDCVFLVIPNLIRDCILGISFLKEEGCAVSYTHLDVYKRQISYMVINYSHSNLLHMKLLLTLTVFQTSILCIFLSNLIDNH